RLHAALNAVKRLRAEWQTPQRRLPINPKMEVPAKSGRRMLVAACVRGRPLARLNRRTTAEPRGDGLPARCGCCVRRSYSKSPRREQHDRETEEVGRSG